MDVVLSASNTKLRGHKCHTSSGSTPVGRALTTTVISLSEMETGRFMASPVYNDNAVLVRTTVGTLGVTPKLGHCFTYRR